MSSWSRTCDFTGFDVRGCVKSGVPLCNGLLYRENPTDLIILDIFMPEKEGLEVIMELKHEFPEVRIIAMSGEGTKVSGHNYLQIVEKLGALQTFHKPFRVVEMIAAVREILGGV